jgi:hypothetical protein
VGRAKHRTQISLEGHQYRMLLDLSKKTRKSISAIIRDLVEEKLSKKPAGLESDPLKGIVGMGEGDGTAVAREHDEILYGSRK